MIPTEGWFIVAVLVGLVTLLWFGALDRREERMRRLYGDDWRSRHEARS